MIAYVSCISPSSRECMPIQGNLSIEIPKTRLINQLTHALQSGMFRRPDLPIRMERATTLCTAIRGILRWIRSSNRLPRVREPMAELVLLPSKPRLR